MRGANTTRGATTARSGVCGNLLTSERGQNLSNNLNNQEIATTTTQSRNDRI